MAILKTLRGRSSWRRLCRKATTQGGEKGWTDEELNKLISKNDIEDQDIATQSALYLKTLVEITKLQ